jgi:hypothetical protein
VDETTRLRVENAFLRIVLQAALDHGSFISSRNRQTATETQLMRATNLFMAWTFYKDDPAHILVQSYIERIQEVIAKVAEGNA